MSVWEFFPRRFVEHMHSCSRRRREPQSICYCCCYRCRYELIQMSEFCDENFYFRDKFDSWGWARTYSVVDFTDKNFSRSTQIHGNSRVWLSGKQSLKAAKLSQNKCAIASSKLRLNWIINLKFHCDCLGISQRLRTFVSVLVTTKLNFFSWVRSTFKTPIKATRMLPLKFVQLEQ